MKPVKPWIYQLVLGLTGENGKYNYSRAVHVCPPLFDIPCSAENYKIAPTLIKLNHGDIKATQGDTGHAQAQMVTEVYAHIMDEERKINAQKFEVAFYANPDMRQVERQVSTPEPERRADLQKLLTQLQENSELAAQLKALLNAK